MKKRNLFLRVAIVCIALFSTSQLAFAQPCPNPTNLISNGDFSSGFAGFTSALPAATNSFCQKDRYGIGTAFDDFCSSFPTTPSGTNMMVVDFHYSAANTVILQQGISGVTAGTNYTVGFRGASRNNSYPVPIDVYYNATFIGTITINTAQAWGNYSLNWTAPGGVASSGNVTFRIQTQHIWNDFALTDIEFSYCATTSSWRNTYENGKDHNHWSVVELEENQDFVVAGTLFERGKLTNTTVGVRRFDNTGSLIWEEEYFLDGVDDARCFDVAVAGSADEPVLAVTGYVQTSNSNVPRTFVMTLDASNGSIIEYKEFTLSNYDQSTALDILYSYNEKTYYVAGYQAEDILDVNGDKIGFVLALDPDLNVNWTYYISSPANDADRNMANNITEIDGKGIFVTGSVNNNSTTPGMGVVSTLKIMLDYGGSLVWDLTSISTNSHECGVDGVYNPDKDELYVLSNNSVVHTFELQRIDNASNAGASIAMSGTNNLLNILGNVEGFSLAFDPNSTKSDLVVAGMIRNMPNATANTPTFIAKVSASDFSVSPLHYIESNNAGYRDHDHDMFQAFYGQQAIINYPDILGVFPKNYVILGYEGLNGYSLSVTRTDANGNTPSSADCEITVKGDPVNIEPTLTKAYTEKQSADEERLNANLERLKYEIYKDCEPLYVESKNKPSGLAQAAALQNGFKVYPNPASSNLQIGMPKSDNEMQVTVRLVDALGRVVMEHEGNYTSGAVAQFNVSNLPEGVYFLSVQADNYKTQEPIVITH